MRVFLKVLISEAAPHLQQLTAQPEDTVGSVLEAVRCDEPVTHLALVREGVELERTSTLAVCGVADGAMLHVICTRRTLRLRTADVEPPPPPPPVTQRNEQPGVAAAGRVVPVARPLEEVVPSATPRALLAQTAASAPAALKPSPIESDSDSDDGGDELPPCARRLPAAVPPTAPTSAAWDQQLSDEPPDDCLQLEWAAGLSPLAGLGCCAGEVRPCDRLSRT